jgi:hypothetical protein
MKDKSSVYRVKMGQNRSGATRKVSVQNWELYVTVNFFDNDQPGEVFVTVGKNGSTISGLMQTIATQFSMLLQAGVPLGVVSGNMEHHRFEPNDDKYLSLSDAVAKTVNNICSDRGSRIDLNHSMKEVEW